MTTATNAPSAQATSISPEPASLGAPVGEHHNRIDLHGPVEPPHPTQPSKIRDVLFSIKPLRLAQIGNSRGQSEFMICINAAPLSCLIVAKLGWSGSQVLRLRRNGFPNIVAAIWAAAVRRQFAQRGSLKPPHGLSPSKIRDIDSLILTRALPH